jgi:tetratricopeptide (TPR) repeat protein
MRVIASVTAIVLLCAVLAAAQAALPIFNTSRLYTTDAEFNRAIQPYQQAVTANAKNARAQYWLGFAHLHVYVLWYHGGAPYASAFLPKAIDALSKSIEADPKMVDAYVALHDAYVLAGDLEKADKVTTQMFENTRPKWLAPIPAPQPGGPGR